MESNLSYEIQKHRQKMHIKVYGILILIVIVSLGFYAYQNWKEYTLEKQAVSVNKELISVLRDKSSNEKSQYDSQKKEFDDMRKDIETKLAYIFPSNDDYTTLTRQLDSAEEDLSRKNSPFEISNIDYQDVTDNENYSILPFRMNIRSSRENFTKFLHLIETSGALDEKVRLMDISSIRINFENPGEEETANEIINFTVQINAYFQK
ncbi:MAG: hypothetical protein ABIH78_01190 [Candidatus Peregrinibacteria bacterium]